MAIVVSLVNMKGGVGKSTVCFNLAAYAAMKKDLKVLVVDIDPQSNVSQYIMGEHKWIRHLRNNGGNSLEIFEQFTPPIRGTDAPKIVNPDEMIIEENSWQGGGSVSLIPSRLELAWTLKNPTGKEHLLAQFLAKIESQFDLILIDCPPTESIFTEAAYRASGKVIVPVKPEFLATVGLPLLARSIEEFKLRHTDQNIEISGIVFNDADPSRTKPEHNKSRREVKDTARKYKWHVFANEIRHSDSFPRGARSGKAIFSTDYARWWVVDEFYKCADEILSGIGI